MTSPSRARGQSKTGACEQKARAPARSAWTAGRSRPARARSSRWFGELLRLPGEFRRRGGRLLRAGRVLLRHLAHLRYRSRDLLDTGGLLLRAGRDLGHDVGHLGDVADDSSESFAFTFLAVTSPSTASFTDRRMSSSVLFAASFERSASERTSSATTATLDRRRPPAPPRPPR